eukprot:Hpha_TRINITY_DN16255_c2_g4::TRINITY_DN16255_c2_g4_i1::g.11780::m.11780
MVSVVCPPAYPGLAGSLRDSGTGTFPAQKSPGGGAPLWSAPHDLASHLRQQDSPPRRPWQPPRWLQESEIKTPNGGTPAVDAPTPPLPKKQPQVSGSMDPPAPPVEGCPSPASLQGPLSGGQAPPSSGASRPGVRRGNRTRSLPPPRRGQPPPPVTDGMGVVSATSVAPLAHGESRRRASLSAAAPGARGRSSGGAGRRHAPPHPTQSHAAEGHHAGRGVGNAKSPLPPQRRAASAAAARRPFRSGGGSSRAHAAVPHARHGGDHPEAGPGVQVAHRSSATATAPVTRRVQGGRRRAPSSPAARSPQPHAVNEGGRGGSAQRNTFSGGVFTPQSQTGSKFGGGVNSARSYSASQRSRSADPSSMPGSGGTVRRQQRSSAQRGGRGTSGTRPRLSSRSGAGAVPSRRPGARRRGRSAPPPQTPPLSQSGGSDPAIAVSEDVSRFPIGLQRVQVLLQSSPGGRTPAGTTSPCRRVSGGRKHQRPAVP